LTFANPAEEVRNGDSSGSQWVSIGRDRIPAQRLYPKAAYSCCRPEGVGHPFLIFSDLARGALGKRSVKAPWVTEANRLHAHPPDVRLPTLVTSGRRDEAMALIASSFEHGIAGSEWMLF
jgi:hypothetical protein